MSPKDSPGEDSRPVKRVRLACSNCRRKKVRCSGERPSCSFCDKLSQKCQYLYDIGSEMGDSRTREESTADLNRNEDLASRVALLESRLTELTGTKFRHLGHGSSEPSLSDPPDYQTLSRLRVGSFQGSKDPFMSFENIRKGPWEQIPPEPTVLSACETFFLYCHNQPYTFFHESKFRRQISSGAIPDYLLFAFLASSMRFSSHSYYDGKHLEALEGYAATSWRIIVSCGFLVDEGCDISVVQAVSLLSIIDSAAGRRRAAWVKIGLAVRISQDLRLTMEPDPALSNIEQEERRRVFWSVYMLDRFVACSKQRPQSISDEDCQVQLPCTERNFASGTKEKTQSLQEMINESNISQNRPGNFALVVLMGSALGRCARYSLDDHRISGQHPPWDPRSEYALINSTLTHLEALSEMQETSLREMVQKEFVYDGKIDQQKVGHYILQQALFHLSHCLIHHPFLLRQHLENFFTKAPRSWLSHAWDLCRIHAQSLSALLVDAKDLGCIVSTSFYGYCALIAGTVHAIYLNSEDARLKAEALQYLTADLGFLEDVSTYWKNTQLIKVGLKYFHKNSLRYKGLLSIASRIQPLEAPDLEVLWSIVDYGVMSDPQNTPSNASDEGVSEVVADHPSMAHREEDIAPMAATQLSAEDTSFDPYALTYSMADTEAFYQNMGSSQDFMSMFDMG